MAEIWNLNTLCRCCHSDGCFKSLSRSYESENGIEIYEIVLQETLSIRISQPPMDASYTICDICIKRLKDASQFKEQVLACERKFKIYCTNEQFLNGALESIKTEAEEDRDNNHYADICYNDDLHQKTAIEIDMKPFEDINNISKDEIIKTEEIEPADDKTNSGVTRKKIRRKKSVGSLKHDSLHNRSFLQIRRKLYESYIVQVKTTNGITFSCKTCEGSYQSKKDLYKHITLQHRSQYKCEECDKHFKYVSQLKKHIKIHEENKAYICQYCNKSFNSKSNLKYHENIHTKQSVYQCDICKKKLKYKNTLRKHIILMHSSESQALLCDVCGRSFKQKSNLEAHIRSVHLKERPYACPICSKTYTAKKHVKGHMKTAHSENPKPYECDVCSKKFACPKSFKVHRLTHDNRFTCRYCPTIFDGKTDYYEHIKTHIGKHQLNSPFGCHLCGKVLMTKFTLNRHIELHDGIKRFSCNICGVKFTQKCLLIRHNRRKHDPNIKMEKTKCDLCKRLVKNINKHMDTHDTDKRKYFCDICGKNYSENNALTRHKNQTHYGVAFNCDVCGKKYMKRKSLETHKFKIHKIKKELIDNIGVTDNMEMSHVT